MAPEASESPRGRPRRRLVAILAVAVAAAALALRTLASIYAADLLVAAATRAASGAGFELRFDGTTEGRIDGFRLHGMTLGPRDGPGWVRAETVSGTARFVAGSPWVALSLRLTKASVAVTGAGEGATLAAILSGFALPPVVADLALEGAHVDLGAGRSIDLDVDVVAPAPGAVDARVRRLDYAETSGDRAAEKLAGRLTLGPASPDDGSGAVRVEATLTSGAALAGPVLFDFAAQPLELAAALAPDDRGALHAKGLRLALGKLVTVEGEADLDGSGVARADLTATSADLMPAFVALVRDPFGASMPVLSGADIEGRGSLRLRFDAPTRHAADAMLVLTLARAGTRDVGAESVDLELPWIGAQRKAGAPRDGRWKAASLRFLGLSWTGIDVALAASPGKLRAKTDQRWRAAGGTLVLRDLVFEDDGRSAPRVAARVALDGFDLAAVGKAAGVQGLDGVVRGDLGRVEVTSAAIRAEGGVELATFGGSVKLSKLTVEDPFGRVPSVGLDAMLSEIDLGRVSGLFGLGRVTGVLEGRVSGLVVAGGQPQAFDADLHTVERRGVSQTVDVRAITQLGVLGGGDSSATSALLKVVDRYRYAAIGVRCRLRNDVFELRGLETSGDKDYLVKGSLLPPSVSVVSHSQVVSFSEMLRRIERITAIGEGGPPNAEPE